MFLARYKTNNIEYIELYTDYNKYHTDTFNPDTEIIAMIDFTIHGKTYNDRKASLEQIAINYSNTDCSGISWNELAIIEQFFRRNGKRYGLMQEFTENAIC